MTAWSAWARKDLALLFLIAAAVLTAGLGLRDPWPADEPRFALIAKEMVESGQWFFPRIGGELYADKPPLFMWAVALFYALTGSLRVSFLLPSLLAGLVTLSLVVDLAARLWNRGTALAAGILLLATLQFTLQAKFAQLDALLMLWTTLGLYGLLRHLLLGPAWGWYYLAFAAMGLGVITKGVGFLPMLVLLPYAYAHRAGWHLPPVPTSAWRWLAGPVVTLVVIGAWLVPMLLQVALSGDSAYAAYRDDILFRQTAVRYAESLGHIKPLWYYLVEVIPVLWLPVTLALPWLLPAWRRRLARRDARFLLLLGWIALVVLFFSLSPGKRGVYLLPAVPALALAAAPLVHGLVRRRGVRLTALSFTTAIVAITAIAVLALTLVVPERGAALVERHGVDPRPFLAVLAVTGLAWLLGAGIRHAHLGLVGFLFSAWLLVGWWGAPLFNGVRSGAPMMQEAGRLIGPGAALGLVAWKEQLMLQADRPVAHFGFRHPDRQAELADGIRWMTASEQRWLLVPDSLLECFDTARAKPLGLRHQRHWFLVDRTMLLSGCPAPAVQDSPVAAR